MNTENYSKIMNFTKDKIIQFIGLLITIFSFILILSLLTYFPEDQIIPRSENYEIQNLFGNSGSLVSDIMFQSFGIISYLFSITLFFIGVLLMKNKKLNIILSNLFYSIIYIISGSALISIRYNESFSLISPYYLINGNGGFVGHYVKEFINTFVKFLDEKIIFYGLLIFAIFFFLLSIRFSIKVFFKILKLIYLFLSKLILRKNKNENKNTEIYYEEEINEHSKSKVLQPDLPFKNIQKKNKGKKFILPPLDFLKKPSKTNLKVENLINKNTNSDFLEKILLDFGVQGKIKKISQGPVVTLNEFEPAPGIKVSKIINLADDIARNTSSESARIAIIPGKNTVGIEIPNKTRQNVFLSEIISDEIFKSKEIKLPITLGKSISGIPITVDLASMPHLLIAGTTGSGKSVCINTIILSLLYKHSPEKCKFILIDPKMLELSTYEGIPHLLCPVITEAKKAASVLGWVVKEMESRYKLMTREGVRSIDGYNKKHSLVMPYIVVIVDEMSDLMLVAGKEIENYIQKLSAMARAAGIHIIMATQRPSVDVITGIIKANFPTRISFQVSSKIDSRTVLGEQGAEQLLGKGDMLFMSSANRITRVHGPYVSEIEIEKVNSFLRSQEEPDYVDEILNFVDQKETGENPLKSENQDQLYKTALELIKSEGKASTSLLQRKLQIGYNRAARIIDMMEENGIVSKANHVGKREVL